MKHKIGLIFLVSSFFLLFNGVNLLRSQTAISLECGDIIEGETTSNEEILNYSLNVQAGTILDGRVEPIGATFNVYISFLDSNGREFAVFNRNTAGVAEVFRDFSLGSSNPILTVSGQSPDKTWTNPRMKQYVGAYRIYLGCTLRDGTVIEPDESAPESSTGGNTSLPIPPTFSGTGFPGLASVDFEPFNFPRLPVNTPFGGDITTDNNQVLGYKFEAAANDVIALSLVRTGNLNLGLVVLSADNQVVFQASLVTSSELTTKFTLPTAGTYTIGVFRIDLLPPAAPEATAFQLTATLNP